MPPLVPFDETLVYYDAGSPLALVAALLSLAPQAAVVAQVTLLASRRDLCQAALLLGNVASVLLNKAAKNALREPRPPSAIPHSASNEFGMPSNHAQQAFFLASFVAAWALSGRWRVRWLAWRVLAAAGALALAAAVAGARVLLAYHSLDQVLAGGALGLVLGLAHFALVEAVLRPLVFAPIASSAWGRWLRLRDCSDVDVLLVEYEAVAAAAAVASRKRR